MPSKLNLSQSGGKTAAGKRISTSVFLPERKTLTLALDYIVINGASELEFKVSGKVRG